MLEFSGLKELTYFDNQRYAFTSYSQEQVTFLKFQKPAISMYVEIKTMFQLA